MGKPNKGLRAKWTAEMLRHAKVLLRRGKSQRYVSEKCGIPRRTLRNHINSQSFERKLGRTRILSTKEENDLEDKIIRHADKGFPLTPKSLRRSVYQYVESKNIKHSFNKDKQLAGREWMRIFLKNHPKISKRTSQTINPARAQKLNRFIVKDHFTKRNELLVRTNLKHAPAKIYNMDEKGCRLSLHHKPKVLAGKGSKRVHLISQEHAENVTIVAAANALGQTIPPVILFKGKRMKSTYSDGLPAGSKVMMTPKGSMTIDVFSRWLDHFMEYMSQPPVLLIFDGAKCHLDMSIAQKAEENGIYLYCLPSNTTHELQPMDKSVFRAFEAYWDDELLKYWDKYPTRDLNRERFSKIFLPTWEKAMSISNITSGFRATGIYPFDKDILPIEAFAPSLPTEKPNPSDDLEYDFDDLEYDSDDLLPLAELRNKLLKIADNSFSEVLSTPKLVKKNASVKRKSLNYRAVEVKQDLFKSTSKTGHLTDGESRSCETSAMAEKWACVVCHDDFVADMRRCIECGFWAHEECVGLTAEDIDDFICPDCIP